MKIIANTHASFSPPLVFPELIIIKNGNSQIKIIKAKKIKFASILFCFNIITPDRTFVFVLSSWQFTTFL
jgi:hypothetical protein